MSAGEEEGFIAPPPGLVPKPVVAEPVAAEAVAADEAISLPPGIVDSGTYRMPSARQAKPATLDDAPAFFPVGAPGLPPVVVPDSAELAQPAVDDETRVAVGRRSAPAWRITLADGEERLVEQTTLVGRDPAHNAQWAQALLLPIIDPGKTISKTHAALELTPSGQLVVHDLDSTNGVYLRLADGEEVDVLPGDPQLLEPDTELILGEYAITVTRT